MNKSTLIELLKMLDNEDIKAFNSYLKKSHSPSHDKLKLFRYLKKIHPNYEVDKPKLSKLYIWQRVLKKKQVLNNKRFSNLMSDLKLDIEQFLVHQQIKPKSFLYEYLILKAYAEKKADQKATRLRLKLLTSLEQEKKQSGQQHLKQFLLQYEHYFAPNHPKTKIGEKEILQAEAALQHFYLSNQLIIAIEKKFRNSLRKENHFIDMPLLQLMYQRLSVKDYPLINWLFRLLQSFPDIDLKQFNSLKKQFLKLLPLIDKKTASNLLGFLFNYASIGMKQNIIEYLPLTFELFQKGIKLGLLVENALIDIIVFNNIVSLSLALGKLDYAKKFVEQYGKYLPKDVQQAAIDFAKAEILFSEKQYKQSLHLLQHLKRSHYSLKFRYYCLTLACYYEIEKSEIIPDRAKEPEQSYRMFLRKKDVGIENNEAAKNFIKIFKQLKNKNISSKELLKILQNTHPIFYKTWLKEAIGAR